MSSEKIPTPESIGATVRYHRLRRNLDQWELGVLAFNYPVTKKNAAHQRITKIENARKKYPRVIEIYQLAKALKIKTDDLLQV